MRRHNLHTHTNYSDGTLSPEILVETAIQKGLGTLGISDHAFSKKLSDDHQITNCLERYLEHLKKIQSSSKNVVVKIGLEIDVSRIYGIDPFKLPFDILNKFDYILFEYVDTEQEYWGNIGRRDISEIINVRNKIDVPVGFAHNDVQKNYNDRETQIADLLARNGIFIELCQSEYSSRRGTGRNTRDGKDYYQHFSRVLIEELLKNGVKVVSGTDSHTSESLANLDDVCQFIQRNNLQYHEIVL